MNRFRTYLLLNPKQSLARARALEAVEAARREDEKAPDPAPFPPHRTALHSQHVPRALDPELCTPPHAHTHTHTK